MTLTIAACAIFISVGLATLYFTVHKNSVPVPENGLQWLAAVMSVLLVCLSGFILAMALTFRAEERLDATGLDQQVEDFAFQLVTNEEEFDFSVYSGSVVLLNFWATWCQPCITELPELDRLQVKYRDQGLIVLTISDESREDLMRYADLWPEETVSGYIAFDALPERFQAELLNGRPVSYVIDRTGVIREFLRGAGSFEYFERLVTPWLEQS